MGGTSQSNTIRILLCCRQPRVQTEQKYISKVNILTSLKSLEFGVSKGILNLNLSLFVKKKMSQISKLTQDLLLV